MAWTDENREYVHMTVTRLKTEFGWTEGLIRKWLNAEDKQAPNPHGRSRPPMRLFSIERVRQTVAANPELKAILDARVKERAKAQRYAQGQRKERRKAMMERAETARIVFRKLPTWDVERLGEMADARHTRFMDERGYWTDVSGTTDQGTRQQRIANMIRHEFTNYEGLLNNLLPDNDPELAQEVHHELKSRTIQFIGAEIPELKEICAQAAREVYLRGW